MILYMGSYLLVAFGSIWAIRSVHTGFRFAMAVAALAGVTMGFLAVQALDYAVSGAVLASIPVAAGLAAAAFFRIGARRAGSVALTVIALAEAGVAGGYRLYLSTGYVYAADLAFVALLYIMQRTSEHRARPQAEGARQSTAGKGAGVAKGAGAAKAAGQSKGKSNGKSNGASKGGSVLVPAALALIAVAGAALLARFEPDDAGRIGQAATAVAAYDETNDLQTARVQVNAAGFSPRHIDFQPNVMMKLVVEVGDTAASDQVFESASLGLKAPLHKGDNIFLVKNPKPGDFEFQVGGHTGTFTVLQSADPSANNG